MHTLQPGIFINPHATSEPSPNPNPTDIYEIQSFHASLPQFHHTPLHPLPALAQNLGISSLLIKNESSRLGLPAFKILGASWGVHRALCQHFGLREDVEWDIVKDLVKESKEKKGQKVVLFAATDGNHGRAVARMSSLLLGGESAAQIYVPSGMYETTKQFIRSEGAEVVVVDGDYNQAVEECWAASQKCGIESQGRVAGLMVQDNAFTYMEDGEERTYGEVPIWIVEGYSTLLGEVDKQVVELERVQGGNGQSKRRITHVVTPIGVGSLGAAVVKWAKARNPLVKVVAVEPARAGCLNESLKAGSSITIDTEDTIMSGMCCGTVSPTSWEGLRAGVDVSVTVGEWEAHEAVLELQKNGIESGPCGAACLAGLKRVVNDKDASRALQIHEDSVVVVLSTEGSREYPVPEIGT